MGSTREEREHAYRLDKEVTRAYGWYEKETRRRAKTGSFCIDRYPVTNSEYNAFIDETGHPEPFITPQAYQRQGFLVHPYEKVKEFLWQNRSFPSGRKDHPVVLVSLDDATSYCARMGKPRTTDLRPWLWGNALRDSEHSSPHLRTGLSVVRGKKMKRRYRLPSEVEWEKAARGTDGRIFPWGNEWNPDYLNSGERFGYTTTVDRFSTGKSPYGLYDMVGNVFEWTASPWDEKNYVVKGCSWDDLPGTCRAAMRHGRPARTKHVLIGFRCASDLTPSPR